MDQIMSKVGKVWKKDFLTIFWAQSVEKVDFFETLGLALGLGLELALQFLKVATFNAPDDVQSWESDEKRIFGQRFGQKVWKKWTFFES